MKWITSYVEAVKRNLSADMRDEVAEELTSNIQSARQELEEAQGRQLNETEIIKLLNSFGHPEKIAANYGRREALIGSDWFGIYRRVLPFGLMMVVVFYALSSALTLLSGEPVVLSLLGKNMLYEIFHSAVLVAAAVTMIFYYLDGSPLGARLLDNRQINVLPAVDKPWVYIPLASSFKHLGFVLMMLIMLNGEVSLADFLVQNGKSGWFVVSDNIAWLLPWISAGLLAFMVLNIVNLFVPYWNKTRLIVNIVVMMLMAALLMLVFFSDSIMTVTTNEVVRVGMHTFSSDELDINARIIIAVFVAVSAYQALISLYRLKTFYK